MFKVGDIVEMTAEAAATGMLDFTKGHRYRVHKTRPSEYGGHLQVFMLNDSGATGWYHQNHFKLKEDTIVEKKECLFKEGQVVWDVIHGKGCVKSVANTGVFNVVVDFGHSLRIYNHNGVIEGYPSAQSKRTLFFSEPKIEAATEPLFEPVLKKGDWVVLSDNTAQAIVKVVNETDTELFYEGDGVVTFVNKNTVDVYRLGEKIEFN